MLWVGDFQVATGGGFWVAIGVKVIFVKNKLITLIRVCICHNISPFNKLSY